MSQETTVKHVSWGPEAVRLSETEREAAVAAMIADAEAQLSNTVAVPVSQLLAIVEALQGLTRLGQATVAEWEAMTPTEKTLRQEVFRLSDMPLLLASQWLPDREDARATAG